MTVTTQQPIVPPQGAIQWQATYALYLCLDYSISSNGNLVFDYTSNSGYYSLPFGIQSFVNSLLSGPPGSPSIALSTESLDFELDYPSYLVFQLGPAGGPGNWQFRGGADAVSTDDTTPNEYFNLVHVQDNGTTYGEIGLNPPANAQPPSPPCHIAYFSAISPSARGSQTPPVADNFNLYIDITEPDGSLLSLIIDPCIRNLGHR
jgi:hypothetical protein